MVQNFLVTVGMPAYNAEKYIEEAIDSILNQTWSNFEFIIIDDGSTDSTREIISKYSDPRIKILFHKENKGIFETRNELLLESKGKYFFWMDADDISSKDRIEQQILFMENNPTYVLCGSSVIVIDEKNNLIRKSLIKSDSKLIKASIFFTFPFCNSTICIRIQELNEDIKKYYQGSKVLQAEDYVLYTSLMNKGDFAVLESFLLKYRIHNSNTRVTSHKNRNDIYEGRVVAWKMLLDYLDHPYPSSNFFSIHDKLTYYPQLLSLEEYQSLNDYFEFLVKVNQSNLKKNFFEKKYFLINIQNRIYYTISIKSIPYQYRKSLYTNFDKYLTLKQKIKLFIKVRL